MIEQPNIEIAEEELPELAAAPDRASDGTADAQPDDEQELRLRLFPDLFISGLTAIVLALCAYSLLCIFLPAGLAVRANPLSPPEGLKPAWYFLFLYRLLHPLPPIVSAFVPVVLLVLLGMWPFIDRNPSREPKERGIALAFGTIVVAAVLVLSYLGWAA